jgi:repressor LexA
MPIEAIENIIETIDIPPEMINFSGEVVALKVSGDSMEPKFYENDIVLIQLTSDCESGQICAVYINGYDVTLKKVIKQNDGILLQPLNQKYPPTFYPYSGEESVTIYGIAKSLIRMMN